MIVDDKILVKILDDTLTTKEIKRILYDAYQKYDKDKDIYYNYFKDKEYNISTLTIPGAHAVIKILLEQDSNNFKNTNIENKEIYKIVERIRTIYDINYLMSNKKDIDLFFKILDSHSWFDRDYFSHLKYKKNNKISVSDELKNIKEYDFNYLCTILSMLLRENKYDNSWECEYIASGIIDTILTKMAYLIVLGEYSDKIRF